MQFLPTSRSALAGLNTVRPNLSRLALVLTIAVVAGLSPLTTASGQDQSDGVDRLAGANRAGTAAEIARAYAEDTAEVVVATASQFADALSAAFLGRPVLLTGRDALPQETIDALGELAPSGVIIIGGQGAISEAVEEALREMGPEVRRIPGESRYGTSAGVAGDGDGPIGTVGGLRTALLASGENFADAMVAGPVAAAERLPILLTRPDGLPAETADALDALDVEQVLIVGGPAAVSAEVLNTVQESGRQVRRLFGDTRQETAVAVAEFARTDLGWQPAEVLLATGEDFPDAIAAGPYAGRLRAPVLLTGGSVAADAVGGLLGCGVARVVALGGETVVSEAEAASVADAAGSGDACAFAPRLTPEIAVRAVGEAHEVTMDLFALADDAVWAQGTGGSPSGTMVRFTVTPDTNSIARVTARPVDGPLTSTGVGGGMEAQIAASDDGTATLRFTSSTPGLALVQACASGEDGEEVCLEGAVQFSARYAATIGDGSGFVQLLDGQMCAAVNLDDAESVTVVGPDGTTLHLDAPYGCGDVDGIDVTTIDAAPADYGFDVAGEVAPLQIIGSDYAEWEASQPAPFVPGPATQANTELITTIGELNDVTAINFMLYPDGRDVLFATGRFGLKSFDVTDPANPVLLDWEEMPDFWENEDMDIDPERQIVMLSRDPRAFGGSTDDGVAGVYLIDASDPADLKRIVFHELPTGHTATCVRSDRPDGTVAPCDYLWSGGPATGLHQPEEWTGRPIFVTDIRDPQRPFTYPQPLLTNQNDGVTGYAHDVQLDADGLAWVSSDGGVYGFHTHGVHVDPLTDEARTATPDDPVPFAGGTLEGEDGSGGVIHNAYRPVGSEADLGADLDASGFAEGELVFATDEAFTSGCTSDGLFNIVTLEGSHAGEGFVSTPEDPFRLRTVGTWSPVTAGEPGPVALCSAHYFDMSDGVVAYSWYGQGTRFIDVTDPTNPIQVAFHRPLVNTSFAPRFRGDVVFVADSLRGIDVIRLTAGAAEASATRAQVSAPALPGVSAANRAAALTGGDITLAGRTYGPDPVYGWSCWIPVA